MQEALYWLTEAIPRPLPSATSQHNTISSYAAVAEQAKWDATFYHTNNNLLLTSNPAILYQ